jgi:hypothetical protein
MKALIRPTLIAMASLALWVPGTSTGESVQVNGMRTSGASVSVDIRIQVPAVMQVIENSHPMQLGAAVDGRWNAQQKLVVHSTMKRGFCVSLRLDAPQVEGWRLDTAQEGGTTLSEVADGYRLCTTRPGRYTLLLQHAFESEQAAASNPERNALRWPVRTDVTAL